MSGGAPPRVGERAALGWLAGAAGIAAWVALRTWDPAATPGFSICLSRSVLGLPCPGCGLTRAFAQLARGDWGAAVALHPLAPLLAAEAGLGWLVWGLSTLTRQRPVLGRAALERLLLVNGALLVAVWIGRSAAGTVPW